MESTGYKPNYLEPRQLRGRQTRQRILDAAQKLLLHKSFEEISVAELVRESKASVGSYYHFFDSKQSMLAPLYDRYDRALTIGSERILDSARWRGRSLRHRVTRVIRYTLRLYRVERGLMRALALHARSHPDEVTMEQQGHRAALYDRVTNLLLECRAEITHPEPESAIRLGLLFVGAASRDRILFSNAPHPRSIELADGVLARELSDAFLAYLQIPRTRKESHHVV
jgi:AcrR family transcriptional regulator